jgi:hypothetical protein
VAAYRRELVVLIAEKAATQRTPRLHWLIARPLLAELGHLGERRGNDVVAELFVVGLDDHAGLRARMRSISCQLRGLKT